MCFWGSPEMFVRPDVLVVPAALAAAFPPGYAYVTVTYATVASKRATVPAFCRTPASRFPNDLRSTRARDAVAHRRRAVDHPDRRAARRAAAHGGPLVGRGTRPGMDQTAE